MWRLRPLKHVARFVSGSTPNKADTAFWSGEIPWASAKDMKVRDLWDTEDHISTAAVEHGGAAILPPRSVLVVVRGMILAKRLPVAINRVPMAINQDLKALLPKRNVCVDFLGYYLEGTSALSLMRLEEAGHGTKALRTDKWESLPVVVPPLEEQRRIAAFLDHETARIDELVREQERLLLLATEKLEASVESLVWHEHLDTTSVPVDERPRIGRLGFLTASIQTGPFGSQLHAHEYVRDGTPVVNPSSIGTRGLVPEGSQRVDDLTLSRLRHYKLAAGDVVLGRRGEMGRSALVGHNESGWLLGTGSMRIRTTAALRPAFCLHVLQSRRVRAYLEDASVGSTMNNLNPEIVSRCPVPLVEVSLQDRIVRRLDVLARSHDALVATVSGLLRLLRERRSALITAAVTGQIDVSTWTPPDDWLSTEAA